MYSSCPSRVARGQILKMPITPVLAVALLVGIPLPEPCSARELATAEEIVGALAGTAPSDSAQPELRLRGLRPLPKQPDQPKPQPKIDLTIHFATDSATIEPDSRDQLREIASAARQLDLDGYRLLILGHTDSRGAASYNLDLSERRAKAVKQALVGDYGLPSQALRAEGRGEADLLVDPDLSAPDQALNRRVELRLEPAKASNL